MLFCSGQPHRPKPPQCDTPEILMLSYLDAALNQLRAEGFEVRDEDTARLSPLGFDHINMLGRYAFILPDQVARGELRPLRDPQNTDDES